MKKLPETFTLLILILEFKIREEKIDSQFFQIGVKQVLS